MLTALKIENYAIIDKIDIQFKDGFNIITGETGAGKSIMIEALSLAMGNRSDSSILRNKEKKCIIEATFIPQKKSLIAINEFLIENDFDEANDIIIRREILQNGKSRAFINDTPTNLTQLKKIASYLIDLNQQFDTLELGSDEVQKSIIDSLSNNEQFLKEYKIAYLKLNSIEAKIKNLQQQKELANANLDYNQFLFNEFETVQLKPNEIEEIDNKLAMMEGAKEIQEQLSNSYQLLEGNETSLTQKLKVQAQKIIQISKGQKQIEDIGNRLLSAQIELADIANELDIIENNLEYQPDELETLQERQSTCYKLLKKHNCKSTGDLLNLQEEISKKINDIFNQDLMLIELEKEQLSIEKNCKQLADKISIARKKVAPKLSEDVQELLHKVGMPKAQLHIDINIATTLNKDGQDIIQFLFDANDTGKKEPIEKVASGGELSRLMLCIKSLVAKKTALPTLIFDEIDTGISGEAAKQVGEIMKNLSQHLQLIAITHQPQIAAKANTHYYIYKSEDDREVAARYKILTTEERIETIAKMMSGNEPTKAALQNAKELIN